VKKGPLFEKLVVDFFNKAFDTDTIERRVMGGTNDRGDVAGIYFRGRPFVVEVKNRTAVTPAQWFRELADECGNADTDLGAVVFHRPKVGAARMGDQGVFMSLRTLAVLLGADDGDL
jgi:hypothetical protein